MAYTMHALSRCEKIIRSTSTGSFLQGSLRASSIFKLSAMRRRINWTWPISRRGPEETGPVPRLELAHMVLIVGAMTILLGVVHPALDETVDQATKEVD